MPRHRQAAALLVAVALAGGCGGLSGTNQCEVPPGTYKFEFSDDGGDCPDHLVDDVTDNEDTVEVEPGLRCGEVSDTEHQELENGCTADIQLTATRTSSGYEDGEATTTVDCPNSSSDCTHDFQVDIAKQ